MGSRDDCGNSRRFAVIRETAATLHETVTVMHKTAAMLHDNL
jgi:hypothetical protein